MKKKLQIYIEETNRLMESNSPDTDWDSVLEDHLNQIRFFQHERLAHLIVTVAFGLFLVIITGFLLSSDDFYTFTGIFLVFLILTITILFYIFHYFFLENSVHKLYDQYGEIRKRSKQHMS
jgi:cytochrome b subunit of formate dehydrogenase